AVLLSSQNLALALTNTQDTSVYQQPDRIAQTQANLARVPTVPRRTLAAAHVRESAQSFLSSSSVSPEQNANMLDFTVTNANPVLAARLATEYAGQFTKFRRELDTAALAHARQDVQGRITALE